MTHDRMEPELEEAFEHLSQVPAPDAGRQADQRMALLEGAYQHRAVPAIPSPRRWALVGLLVAIALALVVGTGGIVYAADVAVPGDALYGMDRVLESAQMALTSQPQAAAEFLLSLTAERLAEAEELSAKEAQESDGEVAEDEEPETCVGADPHPVGQSLAEAYGLEYETIMDWFCNGGFGFGEIMHALETSEVTGEDPGNLLSLRADQGWGQIWQERGLNGKPDHAGPPDDEGNDDDQDDPNDNDQDDPSDDDQEDPNDDDQDDPNDDDQDDPNDEEEDSCVGADPHPVGQRLAEEYELDYETIMDWFCGGRFGFGEIKHALESSEVTDLTPEEVLELRVELGWGQIWQDLDLKGKPDDEDKDKDKDDKPNGPPEDKDKKDKEDKPGGPPDDKDKKDKKEKKDKKGKGGG
jgi:hypothetical protein